MEMTPVEQLAVRWIPRGLVEDARRRLFTGTRPISTLVADDYLWRRGRPTCIRVTVPKEQPLWFMAELATELVETRLDDITPLAKVARLQDHPIRHDEVYVVFPGWQFEETEEE